MPSMYELERGSLYGSKGKNVVRSALNCWEAENAVALATLLFSGENSARLLASMMEKQ